jgi:hypothetical protein
MKKEKSKAGRKRVHPVGSIVRRTKISPVTDAALIAFCNAQDVRPEPSTVLSVALENFLRERGFLGEKRPLTDSK